MRTHNKKDKNINCDVCDFKTDRNFNMKQYQKVHDKVPSDPLAFPTCSDCNKVFKTKDRMEFYWSEQFFNEVLDLRDKLEEEDKTRATSSSSKS